MALKDYYLILGIPRNESPAGIRAAYRDLAKQHHPDAAGSADAERFRELVEAYEVLSDPDRRRYYNHDLRKSERPRPPGVLRMSEAEPMTSPTPSIFDDAERVRPSPDEFFDRYLWNFTGIGVPKGEREEGLNLEVVLTPAEAIHGGTLPVTLPLFQPCPVCGGTGEEWPFPCNECRAQGIIQSRVTLRVEIPPQAAPGTVIELPLRGLGIRNFYLRVHVLIAGR